MKKNPFTPTFGSEPMLLAGREQLIEDVISGLENGPGDPNRATIFTGPRGSGKTVLLGKIISEAEKIAWISTDVTAGEHMLSEIAEQIRDSEFLPQKAKSRIVGVTGAGFGIAREFVAEEKASRRKQLTDMVAVLNAENIGLLITVDEVVSDYSEMIELAKIFQHFVREKREVALIMAGLPGNVDQLLINKSVSFLRRAFLRKLDAISISDVKVSMKKTIELSDRSIEPAALEQMAAYSEGFPLMIQLIGYHVWRQSGGKKILSADVAPGIESAKEDLENMILHKTIREISDMDLRFLKAMLPDEAESKISDIAQRMGVTSNYASKYRTRLIRQGIISPTGRGKVAMEIPMLKELMREHHY
jgi:DNA-binding IscR family transcriptional regulator